ncbi:MAG: flagellar protein FlgN [Bacillota bacterium]
MDKFFALMEELLTKQDRLIVDLIQMGEEELAALKENNYLELQRINGEQEKFSRQLAELERSRLCLQRELAAALDLNKEATLTEMLPHALENQGALSDLGKMLQLNFHRLKELNETNRLLIRQSLAFVNKILQAFVPREKNIYSPTGQVESPTPRVLMDRTV